MSRVGRSAELDRILRFRSEPDLSPDSQRTTLEVAVARHYKVLTSAGVQMPLLPAWRGLIDDTLRIEERGPVRGAVFDPRMVCR
jgi:hypothetical protein